MGRKSDKVIDMNKTQSMRLIKLYESYRFLWDANHVDFRNQSARLNAWKDISYRMKLPMVELRMKMASLLGSYRREKSREKRTLQLGADPKNHYKSRWYAYDALHFLDKMKNSSKPSEIGNQSDTQINQSIKMEEASSNGEECTFDAETQDHLLNEFEDRHNNLLEEHFTVTSHASNNRPHVQNSNTTNEDEFDIFGRSMAYQLKRLPELTAIELMQTMQSMVFEKRKQLHTENGDKNKLGVDEDEVDAVNNEELITADRHNSDSVHVNYVNVLKIEEDGV